MEIGDSVKLLKDRCAVLSTKGVAFSSDIKVKAGALGVIQNIETSRSGQKFCGVMFEVFLGRNVVLELFVGVKESNLEEIK